MRNVIKSFNNVHIPTFLIGIVTDFLYNLVLYLLLPVTYDHHAPQQFRNIVL